MAKERKAPKEPKLVTPEPPTDEPTPIETIAAAESHTSIDHSCSVYRDNSGKALGGGVSEGAANFGAITAAARSVVDNGTPDEAA